MQVNLYDSTILLKGWDKHRFGKIALRRRCSGSGSSNSSIVYFTVSERDLAKSRVLGRILNDMVETFIADVVIVENNRADTRRAAIVQLHE